MRLGVSTKLTTTTAGALEAREAEVFARHKLVVGVPVMAGVSLVVGLGPAVATIGGVLLGGALGGIAGLVLGLSSAALGLSRVVLFGNQRLRRQLEERLGAIAQGGHFVGICETKNNRAMALRLETDDNVGFLRWTPTHLTVLTEGNVLVLAQDDIYGFDLVPVAALPYLPWIRVTYDGPNGRDTFLLMSREASSVAAQKRATKDLYAQLVDWHTEQQLEWLEANRPGALASGEE